MGKPDDIPHDIWDAACALPIVSENFDEADLMVVVGAIMAERERCIKIMYAEREWGGELIEACECIEKGLQPRIIPGWNAPSEDG